MWLKSTQNKSILKSSIYLGLMRFSSPILLLVTEIFRFPTELVTVPELYTKNVIPKEVKSTQWGF